MFNNLLESKPTIQRSPGSIFVSAVLHAGIIALAVVATAKGAETVQEMRDEKIDFVDVPQDEPPPPEVIEKAPPPPQDVAVAPPPPKGYQVLTAPIDIPNVIPDIDLTAKVTNPADFTGKGVRGGIDAGVVGGVGPVTDAPMFDFEVDKPATPFRDNPAPNFPNVLRNSNVSGRVILQFVVDTTGRADLSTIQVLESAHELFTQAVRNALPRMRYVPAEVGGRKVRVWVSQAFEFSLTGN
jgi:periplasmic protein TonB